MTRTALGSCLLMVLLLTGFVTGEEKPFPAETELQAQTRRRELLHRQLKELLASPDTDLQRLGLVFHVLGKYDQQELVPLVRGNLDTVWMLRKVLEDSPISDEIMQALIARLGDDPSGSLHSTANWLQFHAPDWLARPEVDRLALRLLDKLLDEDEEEREDVRELLARLESRLTPHIPRLLSLAEQESKPLEVERLLILIPWNSLGEHRDETIRRLSALMSRHQSRSLDWYLWDAWRRRPIRLTPEELDLFVGEALRYREGDAGRENLVDSPVSAMAEVLDKRSPGWRERPVVREAIVRLRAEVNHPDASHQATALTALIALGETRHPELREYLLKHVFSDKPEDLAAVNWIQMATRCNDLNLTPEDQQRLLQYWLGLLDAPPSASWRVALNGLSWLGPAAKPAMPRLLCQLERMIWDDQDDWREPPPYVFAVPGVNYIPSYFGMVLSEIEPSWHKSLAGRQLATLICDRLQWKLTHKLAAPDWEVSLWEQLGWATPGLRTLVLEDCLHPGDDCLFACTEDMDQVVRYLDWHCPGWHESPEAREQWKRLEPDWPWRDDPARNRLFLRLTLHNTELTREQQRDCLLKAISAGVCLERDFHEALDALDPSWPQVPQVRQAIPKLLDVFRAELVDEQYYPDLNCWRMLKRLGVADQFEYPLLLRLLLMGADLDYVEADLQLPVTDEGLRQRLREIDPNYLQSPEVWRYRQQVLNWLGHEDEEVRERAFSTFCAPLFLHSPAQDDFQQLPALLTHLAHWKEEVEQGKKLDEDGQVIPHTGPLVSPQLWQIRRNLRQQKILDGPILLP